MGHCGHNIGNITDMSADKNIYPMNWYCCKLGTVFNAGREIVFVAVTVLSFDLSADSIFMATRFKIQFNLLGIIIMFKTILIKHFSVIVRRD